MDANDFDWKSDSEKELDIELENEALELDLRMKGGDFYKDKNTPLELYNEFLHNVKEFESLVEKSFPPVRSIFPIDYQFPPSSELTAQQLSEKFNDIVEYFTHNNIELALSKHLPVNKAYQYIVDEILNETPSFPYGSGCRFTKVIDGCDGYCPECFQRDYCETAEEWD